MVVPHALSWVLNRYPVPLGNRAYDHRAPATVAQSGTFACPGSLEVTMTTPTRPPSRKDGCRAIMGDKWAILIVSDLGAGPRRFTELKRGIDGISQRMLTVTLRSLERDGLITRTVHNVMPPNISYGLTPMGISLLEAATPLL